MENLNVLLLNRAKNYIDNLSEEVIKGQNEKAAEGIYPTKCLLDIRILLIRIKKI